MYRCGVEGGAEEGRKEKKKERKAIAQIARAISLEYTAMP